MEGKPQQGGHHVHGGQVDTHPLPGQWHEVLSTQLSLCE